MSRAKRAFRIYKNASPENATKHLGRCELFPHKASFESREDAKKGLRRCPEMRAKGVRPFRCPLGDHFHLGTQGTMTREEHRQRAAARLDEAA